MSKTINFDSRDWDSIRAMIEKINEADQMLFGETDDGESIHFSVMTDENGYDILRTDVFQKNGWIRTNYYDPRDYTIEELYKKEK